MDNSLSGMFHMQLGIILDTARNLQGKNNQVRNNEGAVQYNYYLDTIDELIKKYNLLVPRVNLMLEKEGIDYKFIEIKLFEASLDEIKVNHVIYNADRKLLQIIFNSSSMLSFLNKGAVLPEVTQDRLESVNKEITSLKGIIDKSIFDNLKESKEEFEKGCFLGSSLISWRVVRSCLQKILGEDINNKIEELKKCDLIREKDGKDFIMKANHFSRNLGSHDLNIMPTSSEAISYLGDSIKIVKLYTEYNSKTVEKLNESDKKEEDKNI